MNRWLIISIYCWVGVPVDAADYLRDIKPVFKARCYACHGALKQKAGLRVDTAANIRKGAKGDLVVIAGKPNESELLARIVSADKDERMPPEGAPLKQQEIEVIRKWIAAGLPLPENEKAETDPKDHWAFQIPKKVSLPGNAGNPIDALLERRRKTLNLKTQPQAKRTILLRRLYLDLIGLPPTRAQLNDQRPWKQIVDELLNNPQHGERWGRHWMDVWRYSDWSGYKAEVRNSQKHVWHWRDWIIDSLNDDKSYATMVQHMLAGDEVAPTDPAALSATGYLVRSWYKFNRHTWLDKTIEHSGKAFLGVTIGCAKCHDHMYDPISQRAYYEYRAIFETHDVRDSQVASAVNPLGQTIPRVFDKRLNDQTYVFLRGDDRTPKKDEVMLPGIPPVFGTTLEVESVKLPAAAFYPGSTDLAQQQDQVRAEKELALATSQLKSADAKLQELMQEQAAKENQDEEKKDEAGEQEPPVATKKQVVILLDEFDELDSQRWKIIEGDWKIMNGALVQNELGDQKRRIELQTELPQDFELIVDVTIRGGNKWKSIGFDCVLDCVWDGSPVGAIVGIDGNFSSVCCEATASAS